MKESQPKEINEIAIPDTLKKELVAIQDSMMNTFRKNSDWDYTCGYLPRPELDRIPDIYWETFCFITEINEVIENLNLVIRELSFLTNYSEIWRLSTKGRLSKKYSLTVRTFFYEIFRTKEIYNKYLKYLKKKKLVSSCCGKSFFHPQESEQLIL